MAYVFDYDNTGVYALTVYNNRLIAGDFSPPLVVSRRIASPPGMGPRGLHSGQGRMMPSLP